MVYYDNLGRVCEFKDKASFAHGTQANLYLYDNQVLKAYYEDVACRFEYHTFALLKRIKSRHFIDLIARYSKEKGSNVVDAYTSSFIEDKKDLETYTTEKFITEVYGLFRLADFFVNFNILMSDVHKDSLIFSDHIKLIDPDKYIVTTMSKQIIKNQNRIQLLSALKSYIRENIGGISEERLYNLFDIDKKGDIGEEMQLKLESKEYMTDYLVK